MIFTRQFVVIQTDCTTGVVAFFNNKEDAIDFITMERKRKPYNLYKLYEKLDV